jgi:hypothetical protein
LDIARNLASFARNHDQNPEMAEASKRMMNEGISTRARASRTGIAAYTLHMAYKISDSEFAAMLRLTDLGKRYGYCLKKITDNAALCWLEGPNGRCVLGPDDTGRTLLPIWPHPRFAQEYVERDPVARMEWKGCTPEEIDVHEFMSADLPRLIEDGYAIAAFPIPPGQAVVVAAAEFGANLQYELDQVE